MGGQLQQQSSSAIVNDKASFPLALFLTTLSGLATGLGGLLVVQLQDDFSARNLGISQGLSGGFMIAVTVLEILPESLTRLTIYEMVIWCCLGAAGIYLLKALIPEPDLSSMVKVATNSPPRGELTPMDNSINSRNRNNNSRKYYGDENIPQLNKVLWSGLLTAISLGLHNFPEGIAVSVASLQGLRFSIPLTIAIAMHNIPEGCSVALPIYFGTRDKRKAVLISLLSGLAEPAGVLFVFSIGPATLTQYTVAGLLAVVGGIMMGLSLFELLPQAKELTSTKEAVISASLGFLAMMLILGAVHAMDLE